MSFFNFRDKEWNIIGKRNYFLIFSIILTVVSCISLLIHGLNLGLDFKGGSICELKFNTVVPVENVREALKDVNFETDTGEKIEMSNSLVQQSETDKKVIIIRSKYLEQKQLEEVYSKLRTSVGNFDTPNSSGIGATIGEKVRNNAIIAIGIVLLLQFIYIMIRFTYNWRYGLAVDIALIHDVIVMIGLYSILGLEADSPLIAALLTVIGYSVMDTIVIFDRVRENRYLLKTMTFEELINKSILQTMTRSIYTLLTVLICLIALLVFGGSTLKNFAIALIIGVTSGAYSSIFIACPLVVIWENWNAKRQGELKQKHREKLAEAKQKVKPSKGNGKGKKETSEEGSSVSENVSPDNNE